MDGPPMIPIRDVCQTRKPHCFSAGGFDEIYTLLPIDANRFRPLLAAPCSSGSPLGGNIHTCTRLQQARFIHVNDWEHYTMTSHLRLSHTILSCLFACFWPLRPAATFARSRILRCYSVFTRAGSWSVLSSFVLSVALVFFCPVWPCARAFAYVNSFYDIPLVRFTDRKCSSCDRA